MRIPTAERLVSAWEAGANLPPTGRALELLAAGEPDLPRSALASLPIGERDRRLLQMRRQLLGPTLEATVACASCGTRVEFEIEVANLLMPASDVPDWNAFEADGASWRLRLPTSTDLLAVSDGSARDAEFALLQRCVTRFESGPPVLSESEAVDAIRDAASATIAALDPQADIQLAVACPSCEQAWLADFDIVSFFWAELTTWVRRVLLDVHRLAAAYGWGQDEILAMSPQRRSAYLEMIGA